MRTLYKTNRYQTGMTMYQTMFILVIVGFLATTVVKLGPHYMDNHVVESALDSIHTDYAGANMQEVNDRDIKDKLGKYFDVNMVDSEIAKSVKVTRDKQKVIVSVDYEIRTNFISNIDVVLVFNNEVDLAK